MSDLYSDLMSVSSRIADSFPQPRFYSECEEELKASRTLFTGDKIVTRCLEMISPDLEDNLGHGLDHATKVAVDAGALALLEWERAPMTLTTGNRIGVLAQLAGLLHDLRRGFKDHSKSSAGAASSILDRFPLSREEKTYIIEAIANHEAFVEPSPIESSCGQMLSDVLYDADKFRWGPDNFTVTLWEMLRSRPVPIGTVIDRFPQGMAGIARIKETFRSRSGKMHGPDFIDLGLDIGKRIYLYLQERFEVGR